MATPCVITCVTGNAQGAGTDGNVYIVLFGENGTSSKISLATSETHEDPFEQCQRDVFRVKVCIYNHRYNRYLVIINVHLTYFLLILY